MLKLILTLMMFGVKADSCGNICDCEKLPKQSISSCDLSLFIDETSNQCRLNKDQENFVTVFSGGKENVKFPDASTVVIKTSEYYLNFSDQNVKWIKTVVLSENNLTAIPVFVSSFIYIDNLDLSHNEIEFVDSKLFRTLPLKTLNLSLNSVSQLNDSNHLAELKQLANLDISNNQLTFFPDFFDLPNLQFLNISNNKLRILNGAGYNWLKVLQYLDVSQNELVRISSDCMQLPNLSHLLVAGNSQLGKSRDTFVFVGVSRKLQTLDASRTGLKQVPAALTHSIQSLRLIGNLIRTINCGDLDSYPLLHLLDLTSNDIKFIEEDSVGQLEFLFFLYLTDNQLLDIPRRLPEKLKVLQLDVNKIGVIRKTDLQGLNKLEVLLLNDNNVTVINEGAFSELISLVTLDLSRNPLINLESGIFTGPLSLEILRLSSLAIISTNEDNPFPLSVPERLVALNLSYSPELAQQFLSDTAILMAAKRLQELDLSGGNLEYLRQDLQFFLPQLKLLRIQDNKFNSTQISLLKSWVCGNKNEDLSNTTLYKKNFDLINITMMSNLQETNHISEKNVINFKSIQMTKSEFTTENVNEFDKFSVNEGHTGVISKFLQDFRGPFQKNSLNSQDRNNELVKSGTDERAIDKTQESIKWNISQGEISMYTSKRSNYFYRSLFLILLTAVTVFTSSVLIILRLIRSRRTYIEDIEATALPTVSDIW